MIVDVHCHYTLSRRPAGAFPRFSFEPATQPDGSPEWDACVAPRCERWLAWRYMQRLLGIDARLRPGPELDVALERVYERHMLSGGPIDRIVLLAFDHYHANDGSRPPLPQRSGDRGSDMYTSNSMVAELCRRHPTRFLLGASVHPYRPNAVAAVREVAAAGAVLLKWIPLNQNIDIADPRTLAVLRCCAELGLPVLAHYCEEFTLSTQHREYQSVTAALDVLRRLRREGCMPPFIMAHVSTPVWPWAERATYRALLSALLDEFADAPLYADISALTTITKIGYLRELARRQELHAKLLFGSDFPVPMSMWRLRRDLGRDHARIAAEPSWPNRMVHIFRHMGFNEIVLQQAPRVLRMR